MAVTVDASDLRRGLDDWTIEVHDRAAENLIDRVYERIPIATGRLRGSGQRTLGTRTASIEFTAEHASFTDEGTDDHEVTGNPLLAFFWQGALVIVHSVFVSGVTEQGWFSDVMTDDNYQQELNDAAESTAL